MSLLTRPWTLQRPFIWLASVVALLLVSCTAGNRQTTDMVHIQSGPGDPSDAASIPLPSDSYDDTRRNGIISGAARFAANGCTSDGLALSGPPARILAALTPVGNAAGLVNPEANLYTPPEGVPPLMVWVIAVEGQSVTLETCAGAGSRAFVFVIDPIDVAYTGCVMFDAPMPLRYQDPAPGGFEFEALLDARSL